VIDASLTPIAGSIFQPTGFPDLGAAEFRRPGQPLSLLVESVQSMTNHLEAQAWDAPAQAPVEVVGALPYIEVVAEGTENFLTSSRLEPHRLASAYVREAKIDGSMGVAWIGERLGLTPGQPLGWPHIYRTILQLDPLCLLHGVFFSDKRWHGNPKVRRAISAVVEAHAAAPVVWGGVKRDDVSQRQGEGRGAGEGYGFVPFGRTEYTAGEILLSAVLDLAQIRGYGLDPEATRLLTLLGLWEMSSLLAGPLRLRTACDLEVEAVSVRRPDSFTLPEPAALAEELGRCAPEFEQDGARRVEFPPAKAK
jgi:CRISPR-associated protein Csb1